MILMKLLARVNWITESSSSRVNNTFLRLLINILNKMKIGVYTAGLTLNARLVAYNFAIHLFIY